MKAYQQEFKFHDRGLLEEICEIHNLWKAFKAVKRNKGAPGIDGTTIEEFEENLNQELEQLRQGVLSWTYKPTPVKRVEIPKPNGKGVRLLGIPIIKDRVLHMAIKQALEPLVDPDFSESSYGFRPGKSQRQAVKAAREIVNSGKEHVVDIDLSKFFDRIHHDRLIHRLVVFPLNSLQSFRVKAPAIRLWTGALYSFNTASLSRVKSRGFDAGNTARNLRERPLGACPVRRSLFS